ncbi:hypothetical protein RI138_17735 [Streptomyces sp. C11-1]|uniref:Uncharacterized protein n=1 Tax=Streptomyces durocortorensis TaxID=2811104 RepID=A0ABY9VX93_9ACTN|nr:hypothetical protein [Streptomyces durocortorensis]WNF28527.1 hypothetical protein RI138_17735 [Streptomyces durocortorensis]
MTTRTKATAAAPAAETSVRAPAAGEPVEPVPRWAVRMAHAIPLCVLPSGLWRVALVLGLAGYDSDYQWAVWERPYVIGLSVVSEGLALLALGLVRPWGEVVPRWVPGLRGRRIPIPAVVIPAALGAALIMMLCAYGTLNQIFGFMEPLNDDGTGLPTSGPAAWALWTTYAPLLAWGPLLVILTVAYYRRRRANDASAAARPAAG